MSGLQVLLVATGSRVGAIPLAHVQETMRPLPVSPLAGAPPFVRGLAVIRGAPTPVVDLAALLGGDDAAAATTPTRFVTVHTAGRTVAVAVDGVVGVARIDASALGTLPPLLGDAPRAAIDAIGTLDDALLVVLRAAQLVPAHVLAAIAAAEAS